MSSELKDFLHSKGIATSCITNYNTWGNRQVERLNGIIWRSVLLAHKSKQLSPSMLEVVLPGALYSIWSLLYVATDSTPQVRLFNYQCKPGTVFSMPSWLMNSKTVLLWKHVRENKYVSSISNSKLLLTAYFTCSFVLKNICYQILTIKIKVTLQIDI